jgi:hypothetical protein
MTYHQSGWHAYDGGAARHAAQVRRRAPQRKDEGLEMAKNTGNGFRRGAVTGRTQFQRPDGHWQKRDERTGQLMGVKDDGTPFKGVAREPDGRDTPNA